MGGPLDDNDIIDFAPDNNQDLGREVDAATDVAAAAVAFNNAALPPNLPEWLKATITAKAAAILQAIQDDDARLTAVRVRDEDAQEAYDTMWQAERQRREREWDRSRVEIGNVEMSGADWDAAYEMLSDPKMREQLVGNMVRKRGWTKDRAERAADDALTLAQIAQRKKDGTITAGDEAKADEITKRNPDAVEMVKEAARMKADRGYSADLGSSVSATSFLAVDMTAVAAEQARLKASTAPSNLGQDPAFASAPPIAAHFDAVRTAAITKPAAEPVPTPAARLVAEIDMSSPF